MEDETVRCQDCGFLSCRPNSPDEPLPEVELAMRQDGDRPHPPPHTFEPVCFVDAFDLPAEYGSPAFADKKAAFLTVIQLGRVCRKFEEHQPGLSPQGHMDTIDEQRDERKRINREKVEFRLKMEAEAAKIVDSRAKLEEDRRQFDAKMVEERRRHLVTVVVAIIGFAGAIYGAYLTGRATVEAADRKAAKSAD